MSNSTLVTVLPSASRAEKETVAASRTEDVDAHKNEHKSGGGEHQPDGRKRTVRILSWILTSLQVLRRRKTMALVLSLLAASSKSNKGRDLCEGGATDGGLRHCFQAFVNGLTAGQACQGCHANLVLDVEERTTLFG